jgi:hypothetical protein
MAAPDGQSALGLGRLASPAAILAAPAAPVPMAQTSQAESEFVVRQLGAGRTADEVSRMLCEQ